MEDKNSTWHNADEPESQLKYAVRRQHRWQCEWIWSYQWWILAIHCKAHNWVLILESNCYFSTFLWYSKVSSDWKSQETAMSPRKHAQKQYRSLSWKYSIKKKLKEERFLELLLCGVIGISVLWCEISNGPAKSSDTHTFPWVFLHLC